MIDNCGSVAVCTVSGTNHTLDGSILNPSAGFLKFISSSLIGVGNSNFFGCFWSKRFMPVCSLLSFPFSFLYWNVHIIQWLVCRWAKFTNPWKFLRWRRCSEKLFISFWIWFLLSCALCLHSSVSIDPFVVKQKGVIFGIKLEVVHMHIHAPSITPKWRLSIAAFF